MKYYGCHVTDDKAATRKLICGHTKKNSDSRCADCLRNGNDPWDKIMQRVREGWLARWAK